MLGNMCLGGGFIFVLFCPNESAANICPANIIFSVCFLGVVNLTFLDTNVGIVATLGIAGSLDTHWLKKLVSQTQSLQVGASNGFKTMNTLFLGITKTPK